MPTLVVLGGVWVGRFAYLRITLRPQPRVEYWDAELAKRFPQPPDALPAAQVRAILTSRPFEADPRITSLQFSTGEPYDISDYLYHRWDSPRADVIATKAVLASAGFETARAALETALSQPWYFPASSDLFDTTSLMHLSRARRWAKWLVVHSYWSHAEGRTESAVRDWRLMFDLSRQLRTQAGTIPHLVAMAIEALAAHEMILAAREGIGPVDVHALVTHFDAVQRADAIDAMIAAARAQQMCWLEHVYVPEPYGWMDVSECAGGYASMFGGMGGVGAPSRLWNLASPLFHDLATARMNMNRRFDAYQACRDMASSAKVAAQSSEQNDPSIILDGIFSFGSLAITFELHFRSLTQIEGALASLALGEYHRRHGQHPESLEQLVPDILPRLPIDYGDRQPLRYRRTGEDYLLYSIWSNGVDEGGVGDPYSSEPPDYVFSALRRRLED